jgi:NADH dehydrogenase
MFMTRKILVLGGTGFVGHALIARLVSCLGAAAGRITVPSRRPQRAKDLSLLPTVDVVQADLHDDAALQRLVAGQDAVVNLVAILHGSASAFEQVHAVLPRRLAAACRAAGVKRVVHVSALGVAADAPSNYLRSKQAGETALREAGLDLTVLRPSVIFGEHDSFMNLFAALQALAPVMPLAGGDARFQPVWVEDVAQAIVACLEDDSTIGQTIECAGPRVIPLRELVMLAGHWAGHARPVISVPMAVGKLQAAVLEFLPGDPLMSADNLASMQVPNVASGTLPGLDRLGIVAASIEQVMPPLLARGATRLDAFRRLAHRG